MKIRIIKKGPGEFDVYLQRTRPLEGRNVFLVGVQVDDLRATVDKEVRKMRGETEPESPAPA